MFKHTFCVFRSDGTLWNLLFSKRARPVLNSLIQVDVYTNITADTLKIYFFIYLIMKGLHQAPRCKLWMLFLQLTHFFQAIRVLVTMHCITVQYSLPYDNTIILNWRIAITKHSQCCDSTISWCPVLEFWIDFNQPKPYWDNYCTDKPTKIFDIGRGRNNKRRVQVANNCLGRTVLYCTSTSKHNINTHITLQT